MDENDFHQRLSHITTMWTLVRQAHAPVVEQVGTARGTLMERYAGAVHRYLLGALRDADAADELFQEFALRFVRGDFKNADPQRGRFRDFVKTALYHLICDHQKRRRKQFLPLEVDGEPAAVSDQPLPDWEQEFLNTWREELMERTWGALAELEGRTGQPSFTVLRLRVDEPSLSSTELAEQVGARLGKSFRVNAIRQALHRAREKFTDLLLQEVKASLEASSAELLEQELLDLGLFSYCKAALQRTKKRK